MTVSFFFIFCKFRFDVAHCIATSQRTITSDRNRHCDDGHSQYNHFLNIFIRKMSEEKWYILLLYTNLHSKNAVIIILESGIFELHIQKHLIAVT